MNEMIQALGVVLIAGLLVWSLYSGAVRKNDKRNGGGSSTRPAGQSSSSSGSLMSRAANSEAVSHSRVPGDSRGAPTEWESLKGVYMCYDKPGGNSAPALMVHSSPVRLDLSEMLEPSAQDSKIVQVKSSIAVKGRSVILGRKAFYDVDIKNRSCTCHSWQGERCRFKVNDPRRLCKHLLSVAPLKPEYGWLQSMTAMPVGPVRCVRFHGKGMLDFYVVDDAQSPWLNVIARRGVTPESAWEKYGLNLSEMRWANSESPAEHKMIKRLIKGWLESVPPSDRLVVPPLPRSAQEFLAKQEEINKKEAEALALKSSQCYVCDTPLLPLSPTPESHLECPTCRHTNYLDHNLSAKNPDIVAVYAKYYGVNGESAGLLRESDQLFEAQITELKSQYEVRAISKDLYQRTHRKIRYAQKKAHTQLEDEATATTRELREAEKRLRTRYLSQKA